MKKQALTPIELFIKRPHRWKTAMIDLLAIKAKSIKKSKQIVTEAKKNGLIGEIAGVSKI